MSRMLMLLFVFGMASGLAQIPLRAPAIWIEPLKNGMGLMLADGSVTVYDGDLKLIENHWQSDWLLSCDGQLLGVNSAGHLAVAGANIVGPAVAPYSRPACLSDGGVLALAPEGKGLHKLNHKLESEKQVALSALPDAEIVLANLKEDGSPLAVILTDPTERYAHGVLGDTLEAASLSVYSLDLALIDHYELPKHYVFEQRRVTPLLADRRGILATRSSAQTGAGVVFLEWQDNALHLSSEAPAIGLGNRWLNLFASHDNFAYAVRTPHIGGPLQRYQLREDALAIETFGAGVTNHIMGSRNLDLAVMLQASIEQQVLAAVSQDLHHVRLMTCSSSCKFLEKPLYGRLSSNLALVSLNNESLLAAGNNQQILWLWQWK